MSEIECWSCRNPITTRFTGTVSMTHTRMCAQCTTPPRRAPAGEVQQRQQGAAHAARHRRARRGAAQRAVEGSGESQSDES